MQKDDRLFSREIIISILILLSAVTAISFSHGAVLSFVPLAATLFICSYSDIKTLKVSNRFIPLLLLMGLPCFVVADKKLANILCALFVILCGIIINSKKSFLGGADIKILALLCLAKGVYCALISFVAACLIASLFSLATALFSSLKGCFASAEIKKAQSHFLKRELPFVPFITIGFVLSQFT